MIFTDTETYDRIRASVGSYADVLEISEQLHLPLGVAGSILDQKVVSATKSAYHRLENNAGRIFRLWERGMSICAIAEKYRCPPTLAASVILRAEGFSRKEVYAFFKAPESIRGGRLRREVSAAVDLDYFFSPKANDMHDLKGRRGEKIVSAWLSKNDISFLSENDLRTRSFSKTPDFLFNEPISVDGRDVFWIESKAVFGAPREHARYEKKQFSEYTRQFGCGLVVYWFGFVDSLLSEDRGYLIRDSRFFGDMPEIPAFLDFVVHW